MLHSAKALRQYEVHAKDSKLGKGTDAYFDDATFELRYLVVETSRWLPGRKLLISSRRFGLPDRDAQRFPIELTRVEVESSYLSTQNELPVSWRLEELLKARYGGLDSRGGAPSSHVTSSVSRQPVALASGQPGAENPHLRSLREIMGYEIEANDGPLGVANDFLIDDDGWEIRYMTVDTKSWKPGREVMVPPEWVETFSWSERRIHLKVSRQKLKASQRVAPESHISERH